MVSVTTTGFGPAAIETLARLLDERRRGHRLDPATVVCTRPLVAVGVRRSVGRRSGGVAGVEVTTFDRLVEDLCTERLARSGRHPASDLVVQAALRAELRERPGAFGRVADHRTTEERLVALDRQLSGLDDEMLAQLERAGTGLAADALRVIRCARYRTGPAAGRHVRLELALDELATIAPGARGPFVVHLPDPSDPFESRLLTALARRADCDIVVGLTGEPAVDRSHLARLAAASIQVERPAAPPPVVATLVDVADPDDEVRAAVHEIVAHAALGAPLTRMAILYSTPDPYLSLLAEHLDGAGLPWCGPGRRPLAASLCGRFLLRVLAIAAADLERAAVITLASSVPLADEAGGAVDTALWDHLSRQAGVVDGEHWEPRLGELRRHLEPVDAAAADGLLAFVADLREIVAATARPAGWAGWGRWAEGLLDRYLSATEGWPEDEVASRHRVAGLLGQLTELDRIGVPPDLAAFESLLSAQLGARPIPGRPLGHGLLVAPVTAVTGLDLDRVIVIGLAEGVLPRAPREDSLLPDALRAESRGLLAPTDITTSLDVRAVAAALASAQHPPVVVTARGDLRSLRSRSWPRVLDPLVGERHSLPSHYRTLADHGRPASAEEFGLRALIDHVEGGDPVSTHELAHHDPTLSENLARILDRRRGGINRHVGQVAVGAVDATERLLSATALEAYASCPRSYLLGRVLRLAEDDRPERIDEITPADRGTLMHAILERFIAHHLAADTVPAPGERWGPGERDRLLAIMAEQVAAAQAKGVTGGRVNTRILERRLGSELTIFLSTDDELRAARRSTPIHVELGFGFDDEPSIVRLPDGRSVRLRGWVDRVDRTEDDGLLVIDYKGGSPRAFAGMADDPLDGGRRLQLPLYARVVADKLGLDGPRTALYWLTRSGEVRPVELEQTLESDLDETVTAALDGISGGLFPGVPGDAVGWPRLTFANCRYCDFDRICPTDRQREWESIRDDDGLAPVAVLLRGQAAS